MRAAPNIFAGLLILAFLLSVPLLVSAIVYQLFSGKSLVRGWSCFDTREDNPILSWSSIRLQLTAALVASYIIIVAVFRIYT